MQSTTPGIALVPLIIVVALLLLGLGAAVRAVVGGRGRAAAGAVACVLGLLFACAALFWVRVSRTVVLPGTAVVTRQYQTPWSPPDQTLIIPSSPHVPSPPRVSIISEPPQVASAPTTQPQQAGSKLWVDDFAQFVNTGFQGFTAVSSGTSPTQDMARSEAVNAAVNQLCDLLANRPDVVAAMKFRSSRDILRGIVASAVRNGQAIRDEYTLPTQRPYGTIWKHYLLIDTSAASINPIVAQFLETASIQQHRQWTAAGSLAALSAVILLTYLFLNAATKGYFVWRLRAAALLIVIVAVLVVLAIV